MALGWLGTTQTIDFAGANHSKVTKWHQQQQHSPFSVLCSAEWTAPARMEHGLGVDSLDVLEVQNNHPAVSQTPYGPTFSAQSYKYTHTIHECLEICWVRRKADVL